jgi:hypothetical protein
VALMVTAVLLPLPPQPLLLLLLEPPVQATLLL